MLVPSFSQATVLIAAIAGAVIGCESDSPTARGDLLDPNRVALNTPGRDRSGASETDDSAPSPSANDLAAQAERDVEAFLALQNRSTDNRESTAGQSSDPFAAPESASPQREQLPKPIVWLQTEGSDLPSAGSDQPITPSALFRDPDRTLEIAPPPTDAAADSVARAMSSDDLQLQLVEVRRLLVQQSIDSNQPIRELIAVAAMALIDPDLDLPSIIDRQLTDDEMALLEKFHTFFTALGGSLDDSADAATFITEAIDTLHKEINRSDLRLPESHLCYRVNGFGDYDPFDRASFLAGTAQRIILYLEIDGYTSELNQKNEWVTELSQQLEIYNDRDGIPVWSEDWQKAVDVTATKRRDFFTTQIIALPPALGVGRFHLKIRVRDEKSGALAEHSIQFELVADPKLAAKIPTR